MFVSLICANHAFAADYKPELDQPGKDVVWVPTPDSLVNKMLDLARVGANDTLIDLGAGDGRLVIMAAQRGASALGIEYDAKLVAYATAAAHKAGVETKARFMKADLFASDFSRATVVTLFLGPDLNRKLMPKLLALKPGTRIVSNTHPIGDWPPDETAESTDDEKSVYYRKALLWIVPANIGGVWRLAQGNVSITQRYQMINGALQMKGVNTPLADATLRGHAVSFRVGEARYAGTVSGNALVGSVTTDGVARAWRAMR